MKKRLNFIDNARGLAILLVVFGHCIPGEGLVKVWIFSFHIPLFFIISGYLLGLKDENELDINELVQNRIKTLILPYFIFSICLAVFYLLLDFISKGLTIDKIQEYIIRIVTFQGMESLWFIPCLFLAELIFTYMLLNLKKSYIAVLIGISLISAVLGSGISNKIIRVLLRSCVATLFILCGYLLNRYNFKIKYSWAVIILMILTNIIFSKYNGFVGLGSFELNNIFLYFIFSIVGSYGILLFFLRIDKIENNVLKFYGINAIIVLCTHNIVLEIIRLLDYKIYGSVLLNTNMVGSIILFIMILIIEIPIIIMFNKHLYFLFGKKRSIKTELI